MNSGVTTAKTAPSKSMVPMSSNSLGDLSVTTCRASRSIAVVRLG